MKIVETDQTNKRHYTKHVGTLAFRGYGHFIWPNAGKMQEFFKTFYNNMKTIADSITSTTDFFKDLNMVELKIKAFFASWSFLSHIRSFMCIFCKEGKFLLKYLPYLQTNVW